MLVRRTCVDDDNVQHNIILYLKRFHGRIVVYCIAVYIYDNTIYLLVFMCSRNQKQFTLNA